MEESSYSQHYTRWTKVWMMVAGGVNLELTSHHQANARFLVDDEMTLWPAEGIARNRSSSGTKEVTEP